MELLSVPHFLLKSLTAEERHLVHSEEQKRHVRLYPFKLERAYSGGLLFAPLDILSTPLLVPESKRSTLASGWRLTGRYKETKVEILTALPPLPQMGVLGWLCSIMKAQLLWRGPLLTSLQSSNCFLSSPFRSEHDKEVLPTIAKTRNFLHLLLLSL